MLDTEKLGDKIIGGYAVTREEALSLCSAPLEPLCKKADEIRKFFCGDSFDLCTIINAKSGRCSENCKFCAQSCHNHTGAAEYPLLPTERIVEMARINRDSGVLRYSIVTSGRSLSDAELDRVCECADIISKDVGIAVCASVGLLKREQYARLRSAGVSRIHNNLESSERFFPHVCTTHTFFDKISAIHEAQSAGLEVCSGGIMGLGESVEDRIDMALALRDLSIKSVPINILNPIAGTPFERNPRLTSDEICRIVAVYRFILPDAYIRLAGGRGLMEDKGRGCFTSGANAAISGDMLTTAGITAATDIGLARELGFSIEAYNS